MKQDFGLEMLSENGAKEKYFNILQLFMDNPPANDHSICPFSIHNIAKEAKKTLNINPGQWFGPQMISVVLRNLCNQYNPIADFEIIVCLDGNIFLD